MLPASGLAGRVAATIMFPILCASHVACPRRQFRSQRQTPNRFVHRHPQSLLHRSCPRGQGRHRQWGCRYLRGRTRLADRRRTSPRQCLHHHRDHRPIRRRRRQMRRDQQQHHRHHAEMQPHGQHQPAPWPQRRRRRTSQRRTTRTIARNTRNKCFVIRHKKWRPIRPGRPVIRFIRKHVVYGHGDVTAQERPYASPSFQARHEW